MAARSRTLFLWACDRYPYPHPFRVPTTRPIERGDLIICEMHPKTGGYFTHVERTFCLGEPEAKQLEIYEGCVAAYHRGLEGFGPGKTISTALEAVKDEIVSRGPRHLRSRHPRPWPGFAGVSALPAPCHRRRPRSDQGGRRPL